ncbi:ROK family transcriptional regulator [Alteribacter natronophilus]|uniref:ROK family transcriptional regulator n=1 Tax=Alteribacter natronophilus TaxID=2583810 RepID=UPI00110E2AEE|nr:ROK family transcriptional regulator [Alteribacter natronophilus]TMW70408.1 ROK family transcriptional regulator [Alteribacter natronophilus]
MTGSFQLMKSLNRSIIMNLIRTHSPISRAEIAKKAKLTPPTVTNIVNELLREDLILEGKTGVSKGGRKPILLTINKDSRFVFGVDVGAREVRVALTNLDAELVCHKRSSLPQGFNKEELMDTIKGIIQDVLDENLVERSRILGIGIGMHGIVDHEKGIAVYAPNFGLSDIRLKEELENTFSYPVKVENDARAMALGELWFGNGREKENVVVVNVGIGIGAGVIFNGRLYHGEHGIAGEIGHTIIDLNGRKCACGNYGCLQTVAGSSRIRQKAIEEMSLGRKSLVEELSEGDPDRIDGELVHRAAEQGDSLAEEVFEQTGRFLGLGIMNLINFVNPERVIIGGGVSKAGRFIMEPVKEVVETRALTDKARTTEIMASKLGDQGTITGAATLILAQLFDYHIS